MARTFSESVKAFGAKQVLGYLQKNPEKHIPQIIDWLEKSGGTKAMPGQLAFVKNVLSDKDNKWYKYVMGIFNDIDPHCIEKFMEDFVINSALLGLPQEKKMQEKYNCNIPWTILFDPTSACNMACTGCWAAEYGHTLALSYEDMDKIITQGKELGIYMYLLTGGEPLTRKQDILKLAEKHNDCYFHIFTNTTLIDEPFCREVVRLGNISFAPSIEGSKESTDSRRGEGCYDKVLAALDLLKKYGIVFAVSICYTHANYKEVTSDEFINMLIEKGAKVAWYFHYMPVGADASPDLLLRPEEREYVYNRVRYIRSEESPFPIFTIDFQNDGEYIGGCIAGGRNYCHINSNGDVEPCVFIHYSQANIKDQDLLDCLRQPLFMQYRENQPFNENMLQPCPMLENPTRLGEMVKKSGAHNTDLVSKEMPEDLAKKTIPYAKEWAPKAKELWEKEKAEKTAKKKA